MTLKERLSALQDLFVKLESTPGRNDKEDLVRWARELDIQLSKDLDYCFEILAGQHKLGYTFIKTSANNLIQSTGDQSLEQFLSGLYIESKSERQIHDICSKYEDTAWFIEPLMNREWRLGIGKSQLSKQIYSPMLAKKFDPKTEVYSCEGYYITEKLDGNRCVAVYEKGRWNFYSRSGKKLRVTLDASGLAVGYVYDGELIIEGDFNKTNGTVNAKYKDKSGLVYKIFDIIEKNLSYTQRRTLIDCKVRETNNVKILSLLDYCSNWAELCQAVPYWLEKITSQGGEGVMVNVGSALYQQKRTNALLKVKYVQSMDMRVIDILPGTGKNEGLVGALECLAVSDKGTRYYCKVGSGLCDMQRLRWADKPSDIIGKIIEVEYFSISQAAGSTEYSLRFPRFKRIRNDKGGTSVD